jgi:hypothetical protein
MEYLVAVVIVAVVVLTFKRIVRVEAERRIVANARFQEISSDSEREANERVAQAKNNEDRLPPVERMFLAVFAVMTPERRDALVLHIMEQRNCGRLDAMSFAISERHRDEIRFD